MKHTGKLSARTLLGKSQLRSKPAQLQRPPFELSMTSTQGFLSLFLQRAITFLVPARLENLLSTAAFGDIQTDPTDSRDLTFETPIGTAYPVHPRHSLVRPHGAEYDVPFVVMPVQHVFDVTEHSRAVLLVNTRDPCIESLWISRGEAVLRSESVVPAALIAEAIPGPNARRRGVERERKQLFTVPQCFLSAGAFNRFPDAFGDIAD